MPVQGQCMLLYVYVNLEELYAHAGGRQEREELLPEYVLICVCKPGGGVRTCRWTARKRRTFARICAYMCM